MALKQGLIGTEKAYGKIGSSIDGGMENKTRYFQGFHRMLFGSRPVSPAQRLARKLREADRLCLSQLDVLFGGVGRGTN